jgi:hypothetical protein
MGEEAGHGLGLAAATTLGAGAAEALLDGRGFPGDEQATSINRMISQASLARAIVRSQAREL